MKKILTSSGTLNIYENQIEYEGNAFGKAFVQKIELSKIKSVRASQHEKSLIIKAPSKFHFYGKKKIFTFYFFFFFI